MYVVSNAVTNCLNAQVVIADKYLNTIYFVRASAVHTVAVSLKTN